jgi:PmbA protein
VNGGVQPNNLYLAPGSGTLDELIASTGHGILVLSVSGTATEHAGGTYSRGASGILIRGGERSDPIEGFTIASTLPEMLLGVDGIAADLRFAGTIAAPSFRVAEMTVSGTSGPA